MTARKWTRSALTLSCLLLLAGCASGPPSDAQNIQSAIPGHGNVFVERQGDVVILRGWVEDLYAKNQVLRAAWQSAGVRQVIDQISVDTDFF